ncbi:MAG: hypothetical protein QOH70_2001 [Blastocatellia bacterium]|jgi:hypothetical protein|nr:hypothetical protein [Blastocatellia bacterium]
MQARNTNGISSRRDEMFIASKILLSHLAPLGAKCKPSYVSLLTELRSLFPMQFYKHLAPNGARNKPTLTSE